MKKLLASALAVAFCAPAFADSSLNLYGRVHQVVTHESTDVGPTKAGGSLTIRDANSRFGIRGSEDLGGGLRAIFAYEFNVVTDIVADAPLRTRHAYLGLKTADYGTFVLGSQDGGNESIAPLYSQAERALGTISYNAGPLAFVGSGTTASTIFGAQNFVAIDRQQRVGNALGYAIDVGNYQVAARYSQLGTDDLNNNVIAGPVVSTKENGVRATEVAVTWKNGPLVVGGGASYVDRQESQNPLPGTAFNRLKGTYQAVVSYDFGFVKVAGLAATHNLLGTNLISGKDSSTEYAFTVAVPLASNQSVMLSVGDAERNNTLGAEQNIRQYQLAYRYDFSIRTRAYAGLNYGKRDAQNPIVLVPLDESQQTLAVGLIHNF